ncbi:MAG TPA: hypothetical protein VMU50_08255 [Polyangia bacterium]|nr:hypothetical protein [Polyangia bacterium]
MIAVLVLVLAGGGCAGRHRGPRTLATFGGVIALGGSTAWVIGERNDNRSVLTAGVAAVAAGIAAMVAAGGWMAAAVACNADPDCPDDEQCKEIPAPPGGIPYKQCMVR